MKSIGLNTHNWKEINWKEQLRTKKYWIITIGALVVIAVGAVVYVTVTNAQTENVPVASQIQTAVARRGDLTVFASGVGEVISAADIGVGFDESGTLTEVLVKPGDQVQAGQVMARLDTGKTEADIALALAEARLNVLTAQKALDELHENSELNAAQALKAVEDAQQALEDLQDVDLQQAKALQAIAEAEDALRSAQSAYNGVRSTASQATIDAAYAELIIAQDRLKDQQQKFSQYADKPDSNLEKANAQLKLSQAQAAYDTALRYYNAVTGTGSEVELAMTEADLAAAKAQLSEAQRDYERIKDGPAPSEIALAEAQLAVANANYEKLKNGPDPSEIALAEANLANADAKLAVVEQDQAIADLVAPMDGTVLAVNGSVGEEIGSGAVVTLADLSQPILTVYLDESDLDKVVIGYEADVTFDSLPDSIFTGKVIEINPSLQTVGNVDTVVAKVQLDENSYSKPLSLPVGSNAAVDVVGGRTQNAVLVPVEALREISPGEYAVFVMENGQPKLRVVTVGLMDYTSAEIISGVELGEIVSTGVVETNQ